MCMPLSSKFLTKSTGKNILQVGRYLAKIWTKCNSLLFGPPCYANGAFCRSSRRGGVYIELQKVCIGLSAFIVLYRSTNSFFRNGDVIKSLFNAQNTCQLDSNIFVVVQIFT